MRFVLLLAALLATRTSAAQTDASASTLEFSEVTPELIGGLAAFQRTIVYPAADREAGNEGLVVVRFIVRDDGIPVAVEVARSASPGLDSAAVTAVRAARFVPGRQDGQTVNVRMALPVRFRISDSPPREAGFQLGVLMSRLGEPWTGDGLPAPDSVWTSDRQNMRSHVWNATSAELAEVGAYVTTDTLRLVSLRLAPGESAMLRDVRERLDESRVRVQDDGYVLAYDLATNGLSGAADVRLDAEQRVITYRQPLCRSEARAEACAPPFPTLIGGLRGLQESLHYPVVARRAGTSGLIDVTVDVQADGTVSSVRAVNRTARGIGEQALAEAAIAAVSRAMFTPAIRAGVPVASTITLPIRFSVR
ncbi:MAG TPA: energy transducer TonB [Rubricoccaceae bacterium]|jgi:TonB family protein